MIKIKNRKILLLRGDGIGPEVFAEVKKIPMRSQSRERGKDGEVKVKKKF